MLKYMVFYYTGVCPYRVLLYRIQFSPDLQIQAQTSLIYIYYKSYTPVISSGPRSYSLLFLSFPCSSLPFLAFPPA